MYSEVMVDTSTLKLFVEDSHRPKPQEDQDSSFSKKQPWSREEVIWEKKNCCLFGHVSIKKEEISFRMFFDFSP